MQVIPAGLFVFMTMVFVPVQGADYPDMLLWGDTHTHSNLSNEAVRSPSTPEPAEVAAYYAKHKQDYFEPANVTFTHVFISFRDRDREPALHEAQTLLETLKADVAGFEDATQYGERFLFHTNYVERTREFVTNDFGMDAAEQIFSEQSPVAEWFGPVESAYGAHLIFISKRIPGRFPSLAGVRRLVAEDYRRALQRQHRDALADAIIQRYSPVIQADVHKPGQAQTSTQ